MAETNQHNLDDHGELSEIDRLLSLLTDGEATDSDRQRFEQYAAGDAELWRRLADAQESAAMLERYVDAELAAALDVDLPVVAAHAAAPARSLRGPWIVAGVGWAAVLVLAVLWTASPGAAPSIDGVQPVDVPTPRVPMITYDEAYNLYLEAPWVRGQMQPHLTEIEPLDNGMMRYWIMRRIEEFIDVPADQTIEIDGSRNLQVDPAALRNAMEPSDDNTGESRRP